MSLGLKKSRESVVKKIPEERRESMGSMWDECTKATVDGDALLLQLQAF